MVLRDHQIPLQELQVLQQGTRQTGTGALGGQVPVRGHAEGGGAHRHSEGGRELPSDSDGQLDTQAAQQASPGGEERRVQAELRHAGDAPGSQASSRWCNQHQTTTRR